jgi:hypothetical protein
MKVFTVELVAAAPKSLRPFQVVVEGDMISTMANILESSPLVTKFSTPDVQFPGSTKFARNIEAMTDHEVLKSITDAIDRINEDRIQNYGGCYVDSFVGSPGDYSPPDCNCEKCIASGRAYRHNSYSIVPSPQMLEYFYTLLVGMKETKRMRSGLEYILPTQCRIAVYNQGNMTICSNKPEIRIGVYVWSHEDKAWRSAQ